MITRCAFLGLGFCFLVCASVSAVAAQPQASGSCTQSAPSAQHDVVAVPDYAAQSNDLPDPDLIAAQQHWAQYQQSVFEALSASADPRDWVIAASFGQFTGNDASNSAQRDELARRAAVAAPNDALVQWLALGHLRNVRSANDSVAAQALQVLEPDNAAVWLETLIAAAKAKDPAGVDIALQRMADSKRVDLHYLDIVRLAADAYRRYPQPQSAAGMASDTRMDQDTWADVMGAAFASVYALPAFQSLVKVCRIDPQTGANALHANDCARIGRLFVMQSDTVIAQRIGFALLRGSHTFTDDDVQIARQQDWVFHQYVVMYQEKSAPQSATTFMQDFYAARSELGAMRTALERDRKALQPPADWVDDRSPFSAQRLAEDANRHD